MESQPVIHVADLTNLLCSIMDEKISTDENEQVFLKVSADHGQEIMKIGLEVHSFSYIFFSILRQPEMVFLLEIPSQEIYRDLLFFEYHGIFKKVLFENPIKSVEIEKLYKLL